MCTNEIRMAHLHGHSTYSSLDGYGTPDQIVARMQDIGHGSCCMTDHGNIYGHVPFQKAMGKAGLKPLFGCEFYVVDDLTVRDKFNPSLGAEGFPHVTVLAMDQQGYENLLKLVTIASCQGFYYKPRIDWQTIAMYQQGLLVMSGCVGGYPCRMLHKSERTSDGGIVYPDGNIADAWDFMARRKTEIEHFYVELVPEPGIRHRETGELMPDTLLPLLAIAADLNMKCVMTADAHFPRPEDHRAQDILLCIGLNKRVDDPSRYLKLPDYQYYCTADELLQRAYSSVNMCADSTEWSDQDLYMHGEFVKALELTADLADMCNVEIPKAKPVSFYGNNGHDAKDVLTDWIEEGIQYRMATGTLPRELEQDYRDRASREYDVIAGKGFADYLLTITDIAKWAKSQNTLVMCRGSAGGCLLLWLLRCSETDAVRHTLSFERFYDETRNDPPDVDMDFETWFRPKVIEYIYSKYGRDKCSQVAALTLLRAKNAVQDVAAVFGISDSSYRPLSMELDSKDDDVDKQIDGITDPEALKVLEAFPQLRLASKLVGQVRQQSVNAAGFIISSEPLTKAIATITAGGDVQFSSVDKHGAADIGLLKLDLLGVAAFDVIGHAIRGLGLNFEDLYKMPVGDQRDKDRWDWQPSLISGALEPALNGDTQGVLDAVQHNMDVYDNPPWKTAYELVAKREVVGVFQIDGSVMQVAKQAGLDRFEELYAASALCRPGAMDHVPEYSRNKHSASEFETYLQRMHPIAREIVRTTYGILVYQEQVMAICRLMGKMPWPQIHKLRKRIASASFHGFELGPEYSDDFFRGCTETGVTEGEAKFWWSAIKAHGIYSFNKSHCVTYGIVGYWMLWLKANHPEAYYEAYLRVEGGNSSPNPILMKRLVKEYTLTGGKMLLLDPATSRESFHSPRPGLIIGGWANVQGIGTKRANDILRAGPFTGWDDPKLRTALGPTMYYKLYEVGATWERDEDVQGKLELAQWLPVPRRGEKETVLYERYKFLRPGDMPKDGSQLSGTVTVGGYLTAKYKRGRTGQFRGEQILWTLEDEGGLIIIRVARKLSTTIGARLKECKMGDYIAVRGWWAGDVMFVSEFHVMLRRD